MTLWSHETMFFFYQIFRQNEAFILTITTLWAESADNKFSYFSHKIDLDISCILSPEEIVCIKCQSLFSGKKNKKDTYISKCCLLKFLPNMLSLKQ